MLPDAVNLLELPRIRDAQAAHALFRPLAAAEREVAAFAYLDAQERLVGLRQLPPGGAQWTHVPTRQVARDAVAFDAVKVVMAHNHPSGDPTPSAQDLAATRLLARALAALGMRLADHLVLAQEGYVSLRAEGLL